MSRFRTLSPLLRECVGVSLALALGWSFAGACVCDQATLFVESHCASHESVSVIQASCCCASTVQPARAVVVRHASAPARAAALAAPAVPASWAQIASVLPAAPIPVDHSPPPRLIALRI